jgi:hypothetical protein
MSLDNLSPSNGQAAACQWRITGAAVPGISHLKQGLPCQDAAAYQVIEVDGMSVLLIALADGAGSAEFSDQGAQLAVKAALDSLEANLQEQGAEVVLEDLLLAAFEQARQALGQLSEQEQLPLRSLATTLTCVVALPGRLAVAQLGDGVVVIEDEQGELRALTQPQRGEYANETYFLIQEDALEQVQIENWEWAVRGLAVMSDGLMRLALKLPLHEPHQPFFKPLFAFAAGVDDAQEAALQLGAFLESERVCERTDDDKALVLAVCTACETVAEQQASHASEEEAG